MPYLHDGRNSLESASFSPLQHFVAVALVDLSVAEYHSQSCDQNCRPIGPSSQKATRTLPMTQRSPVQISSLTLRSPLRISSRSPMSC
jgi:hypothetical protein